MDGLLAQYMMQLHCAGILNGDNEYYMAGERKANISKGNYIPEKKRELTKQGEIIKYNSKGKRKSKKGKRNTQKSITK